MLKSIGCRFELGKALSGSEMTLVIAYRHPPPKKAVDDIDLLRLIKRADDPSRGPTTKKVEQQQHAQHQEAINIKKNKTKNNNANL